MEDSIINLLFTEDLVSYVVTDRGIAWHSEMGLHNLRSEIQKSPFKSEVSLAIFHIWEKCYADIWGCYLDLKEMAALERNQFGYYAMKSVHLYFENGYSHGAFLGYCAMLIGVGYNNAVSEWSTTKQVSINSKEVLQCVCEILSLVLTAVQLIGEFERQGGWDGLLQLSQNLLKTVEE
ncbi:uncharacterized protein TNCV_3289611 [Trichonephila clavipes]|nr:uncharacterized protein TNCV_3289611 [Trichonephila clavipes]